MRKKLIYWLFEHSQRMYIRFKNKKPWGITSKELLKYPNGTFGNELGAFLNKNGFELLPKVERHDAYHLITGYGTKVEDEIALQYLCFGNGKRSFYLFGVVIVGSLMLPEFASYYLKSYKLGKKCNPFHHLEYQKLFAHSLSDLREIIFNKQQILQIQ
ncbi:Coq4 family protein [Polaribacter cellanae]|uniref:Coenzyme Q (Ubiquinone) biosynthesis protein Coq4 n=1 Tax=Polaribacter cellanae TaxID=2818493 RepID=A0A975CM87_9FLAO|nr:Coq4 family protein [Polaribacter cellanae]QTE22238.1 hypothetical protein J3359_15740 [Polaribacter cellanae]